MRFLVKPAIILFLSGFGLAIHAHVSIITPGFSAADTDRVAKTGNNANIKPGEIKKEICSIDGAEISKKKTEKKAVLKGEISGINTFYIELPDGRSYIYKPGKRSVSVFLVTHGKGFIY